MADPVVRNEQWQRRFDTHIEPINLLVDELRISERGWLPYVAPMYGGVNARLLSVLRDPGPKTRSEDGRRARFHFARPLILGTSTVRRAPQSWMPVLSQCDVSFSYYLVYEW